MFTKRMLQPVLLMLIALAIGTPAPGAATPVPRILIVGDSWSASITAENRDRAPSRDVFDHALAANGLGIWETRGAITAWSGRKASDWARDEHLAEIVDELHAFPSIDIVHLIIGGNDFLTAINRPEFHKQPEDKRAAVWAGIAADIQTIVDNCLAVRPDIRVVIAGYDYLNYEKAKEFWGMNFHGASVRELNSWFLALGKQKQAIARSSERCAYVENWGTLQYWFGEPPQNVPLPGGDPNAPMPSGVAPDGIHPHAEAHAKLLQNAIDKYYVKWLPKKPGHKK